MPLIISFLLQGLLSITGSLVGRVMFALGFGFVEYQGFQLIITQVTDYANQAFSGFENSSLVSWAGFMRLDIHLSLILSAIGVKVILNAMGGTSLKKMIHK